MPRIWILAALAVALTPAALAHDADCPVCKLKVVQDTREQDNEVVLRYGRKRIEYRCLQCALLDSQSAAFPGDLMILAPSEKKAQPVLIERKAGKWSVAASAVFVGARVDHKNCHLANRAFHQRAAFDAHIQKHGALLAGAKPLTLEQMLTLARPEAPKE